MNRQRVASCANDQKSQIQVSAGEGRGIQAGRMTKLTFIGAEINPLDQSVTVGYSCRLYD